MNNPTPSPEIVGKWKQEFMELWIALPRRPDDDIGSTLQGFLMARSTVVIPLPNFQLMDDPDGQGSGEYVMREVLEISIEKQGYRVSGDK